MIKTHPCVHSLLGQNGPKWSKMVKLLKSGPYWTKLVKQAKNGPELLVDLASNDKKNGQNWSKWPKMV